MELLKYSISLQLDIFFQKQKNGLREGLAGINLSR